MRSTFISNTMGYSRKKQKGGGRCWEHTFLKTPWNFSFIYFRGNFRQINSPPLVESVQNRVTSVGNSKTKNQDPWKFNIILSWSLLKIPHSITLMALEIPYPQPPPPPPLFLFFSGIAQCKKSLYFFFIWFWLVFYPSWFCLLRTGKTCTSMTKVICWNSSWVTVCVKPVTYIQENTLGG